MVASSVLRRALVVLLVTSLAPLVLGGCGDRAAGRPPDGAPADDARGPAPSLRIVQPRAHARIPLWEEARRLGKVSILFDVGSTRLETPTRTGHRLLTRIDDRPATRVHDVQTALIRKSQVGSHVLYAWLVDPAGETVAEASVPFRVVP